MNTSANAEVQAQRLFEHRRKTEEEQEQQQSEARTIFLSHSRVQKDFVEHLDAALRNANHNPFLDVKSLPRGEVYPERLRKAAKNCKLGVAVLSEEYMISEWPMRELEIFTKSSAKILPLFYKLTIEQVKSPKNMLGWKAHWEDLKAKDATIDPNEWEKAVKLLLNWGSDDFMPAMGEVEYIKKIVDHICKLIPPPLPYDEEHVRGKQQLVEDISQRFEGAEWHCKSVSKARVIGIHGVGGGGKTTICQLMANFYCQQYSGRSETVEFPSNGDQALILEGCKKVLRRLAHVNEDHALKNIDNFDRAVGLMRENMKRNGVFLAIDNVWENSLDKARKILKCGYDSSSKVLVTSRSKYVLEKLLEGCGTMCIACVPRLEKEEALLVIKDSGKHNLEFSPEEVERVLELCCFDSRYHPLALKALGLTLVRTMDMSIDAIEAKQIFFKDMETSNTHNEPIALLQRHFDGMPKLNKHIFLDVVLVFSRYFGIFGIESSVEDGCVLSIIEQLNTLYDGKCSGSEIRDILRQLKLEGLLEFGDVRRRVRVHDLYVTLAEVEAHDSSRFLFLSKERHRGVEAMKPERVFLFKVEVEEVALVDCSRVELVFARDVLINKGLQLEGMTSLRLLLVDDGHHRFNDFKYTVYFSSPRQHPSVGWCINLRRICLQCVKLEKRVDLSSAKQLELLQMLLCEGVEEVMFPPAPGQLRQIELDQFRLKQVPDWSGYTHLQKVQFHGSSNPTFQGINALRNLQSLNLFGCPDLQGLGVLTTLRKVVLTAVELEARCQELEALTDLQMLNISECQGMKSFLDLKALSNLEYLDIRSCPSLEKLSHFGSHPMLRSFHVYGCKSFKDMEGLRTIKNLESEVARTKLIYATISGCPNFKGYEDTITAEEHFGRSEWIFDRLLNLSYEGNVLFL